MRIGERDLFSPIKDSYFDLHQKRLLEVMTAIIRVDDRGLRLVPFDDPPPERCRPIDPSAAIDI